MGELLMEHVSSGIASPGALTRLLAVLLQAEVLLVCSTLVHSIHRGVLSYALSSSWLLALRVKQPGRVLALFHRNLGQVLSIRMRSPYLVVLTLLLGLLRLVSRSIASAVGGSILQHLGMVVRGSEALHQGVVLVRVTRKFPLRAASGSVSLLSHGLLDKVRRGLSKSANEVTLKTNYLHLAAVGFLRLSLVASFASMLLLVVRADGGV